MVFKDRHPHIDRVLYGVFVTCVLAVIAWFGFVFYYFALRPLAPVVVAIWEGAGWWLLLVFPIIACFYLIGFLMEKWDERV